MSVQVENIRNEPLLQKKWNFTHDNNRKFPGDMLVTGANSFIGCHIIDQLKDHFPGNIHLLLRAPSVPDAINKLKLAFRQWGLEDFDPGRFIIHCGDVCQAQMGMNQKEYDHLKNLTGQVIHLAMTPMYHLPYHHFRRIWIPELEHMIAFCGGADHPKFLHYSSSFNANFFHNDKDFAALNTNAWQSGYAGFKWVAGQALKNAMKMGLGACIYDIPLVLGSEKNGICPIHYSIWLILDIFLKTGLFFPFEFKIIPVDILAETIVSNVGCVTDGDPAVFVRPLLAEPVTDRLFSRTAANLLGLREAELPSVREACHNKLRFDFMMPADFYELLKKVSELPAVFPERFETAHLPLTPMVFMSNLNRILSGSTVLQHSYNK